MPNATTVADRAAPSLDHVCPTRKPPQPWLRHATPSLPRQLRLHAAVAADHSQRSHRDLRCAPHTATTVAVSFSALTATTMAELHHTTSWPLAQCPTRALDATNYRGGVTHWLASTSAGIAANALDDAPACSRVIGLDKCRSPPPFIILFVGEPDNDVLAVGRAPHELPAPARTPMFHPTKLHHMAACLPSWLQNGCDPA